ncbi:hypothetical protein QMK17_06590 [Rhodococcus sp. G-MC3]|uniref:hypothetical protein n=1 Tax=Rhodococcus sp. G-MC3 TaxID=3046209 RepID=UPI0024BB66D8|nr:hypothetical protein [Rhodococcus sp. G-MC3]MDJ0392995.1 hypothetical protein [Rhodococcus sp. G-MC3]
MTRPSDGELVGWTVSENYDETRVDAVNPVGHALAVDLPVDQASNVLVQQGLSSLSEPVWARAPIPLLAHTDLRRPEPTWRWRRIVLVQLEETRVWIRPAYPSWEERRVELPLAIPVDDVLVTDPPAEHE